MYEMLSLFVHRFLKKINSCCKFLYWLFINSSFQKNCYLSELLSIYGNQFLIKSHMLQMFLLFPIIYSPEKPTPFLTNGFLSFANSTPTPVLKISSKSLHSKKSLQMSGLLQSFLVCINRQKSLCLTLNTLLGGRLESTPLTLEGLRGVQIGWRFFNELLAIPSP